MAAASGRRTIAFWLIIGQLAWGLPAAHADTLRPSLSGAAKAGIEESLIPDFSITVSNVIPTPGERFEEAALRANQESRRLAGFLKLEKNAALTLIRRRVAKPIPGGREGPLFFAATDGKQWVVLEETTEGPAMTDFRLYLTETGKTVPSSEDLTNSTALGFRFRIHSPPRPMKTTTLLVQIRSLDAKTSAGMEEPKTRREFLQLSFGTAAVMALGGAGFLEAEENNLADAQGQLLHSFRRPLTEDQRKRLLTAYASSKREIPHRDKEDYFQELTTLISTPEGMRHQKNGAVAAYPSPFNEHAVHFRTSAGPSSLFLSLEPSKARFQFDGTVGTLEEMTVAFRNLPDPFRQELFRIAGIPLPTAGQVAQMEKEWERIELEKERAQREGSRVKPSPGLPRPQRIYPSGEAGERYSNQVVDVGTAEFGVTSADSKRPLLETFQVAQCLVCTLWDPETQVAGMAHFWWLRDPEHGLDRFLTAFQKTGGQLGPKTQVRLIGGQTGESEGLVARLRGLLTGKGSIVEEDLLGDKGQKTRAFRLDSRTGRITDTVLRALPEEEKKTQQTRENLRKKIATGPGLYLWDFDGTPPQGEKLTAYLKELQLYVQPRNIQKVYLSLAGKTLKRTGKNSHVIYDVLEFERQTNRWGPLVQGLRNMNLQVWLTYWASWWADPDPEFQLLSKAAQFPEKRPHRKYQKPIRGNRVDFQAEADYDFEYAVPTHAQFHHGMLSEVLKSQVFQERFDGVYVHLEPYHTMGDFGSKKTEPYYLDWYLYFLKEAHRIATEEKVPLMVNSWQGALDLPAGIYSQGEVRGVRLEGRPLLEAVRESAEAVNIWVQGIDPGIHRASLAPLLNRLPPSPPLELTLELFDDPDREWVKKRPDLDKRLLETVRALSQEPKTRPFSVTIRGNRPGLTAAPNAGMEERTLPGSFKRESLDSYETVLEAEAGIIFGKRAQKQWGEPLWVGGTGVPGSGKSILFDELQRKLQVAGAHPLRLGEDNLGFFDLAARESWKSSDPGRWKNYREWLRWDNIRKTMEQIQQAAARAVALGPQDIYLKQVYDRPSGMVSDLKEPVRIFPDTIVLYDGTALSEKDLYPPGTFSHLILLEISYQKSLENQIGRAEQLGRRPGRVEEITSQVSFPFWRKTVAENHPESAAHSIYDMTDFSHPVRLIHQTSAGMEEKEPVRVVPIEDYPRITADPQVRSRLDVGGPQEVYDAYIRWLNDRALRPPRDFQLARFMRRTPGPELMADLDRVERVAATSALPVFVISHKADDQAIVRLQDFLAAYLAYLSRHNGELPEGIVPIPAEWNWKQVVDTLTEHQALQREDPRTIRLINSAFSLYRRRGREGKAPPTLLVESGRFPSIDFTLYDPVLQRLPSGDHPVESLLRGYITLLNAHQGIPPTLQEILDRVQLKLEDADRLFEEVHRLVRETNTVPIFLRPRWLEPQSDLAKFLTAYLARRSRSDWVEEGHLEIPLPEGWTLARLFDLVERHPAQLAPFAEIDPEGFGRLLERIQQVGREVLPGPHFTGDQLELIRAYSGLIRHPIASRTLPTVQQLAEQLNSTPAEVRSLRAGVGAALKGKRAGEIFPLGQRADIDLEKLIENWGQAQDADAPLDASRFNPGRLVVAYNAFVRLSGDQRRPVPWETLASRLGDGVPPAEARERVEELERLFSYMGLPLAEPTESNGVLRLSNGKPRFTPSPTEPDPIEQALEALFQQLERDRDLFESEAWGELLRTGDRLPAQPLPVFTMARAQAGTAGTSAGMEESQQTAAVLEVLGSLAYDMAGKLEKATKPVQRDQYGQWVSFYFRNAYTFRQMKEIGLTIPGTADALWEIAGNSAAAHRAAELLFDVWGEFLEQGRLPLDEDLLRETPPKIRHAHFAEMPAPGEFDPRYREADERSAELLPGLIERTRQVLSGLSAAGAEENGSARAHRWAWWTTVAGWAGWALYSGALIVKESMDIMQASRPIQIVSAEKQESLFNEIAGIRPMVFSGGAAVVEGWLVELDSLMEFRQELTDEQRTRFFGDRAQTWILPVSQGEMRLLRLIDQAGIPVTARPAGANRLDWTGKTPEEVKTALRELDPALQESDALFLDASHISPEEVRQLLPEGARARTALVSPARLKQATADEVTALIQSTIPGQVRIADDFTLVRYQGRLYLLVSA